MNSIKKFLAALAICIIASCNNAPRQNAQETAEIKLNEDSVLQIAKEAFVFGYPLLLVEYTRRIGTNVETISPKGFAPMNQVSHKRNFPDHTFTEVVKPNCDTYYSSAFFDLKTEPIVLSVPATNRYYLLPLLDAYTNVFASPGTRTTGTGAGKFLLAGPNWQGEIPEGMKLINAPTNLVWMIGRTQVNSAEDGKNVVYAIQDNITAVPLSAFGTNYSAPKGTINKDYINKIPGATVASLSITQFFDEMTRLMADNPPSAADSIIVKRMASIGLERGKPFSIDNFPVSLQEKLAAIPTSIIKEIGSTSDKGDPEQLTNGWKYMTEKVGEFGTDYALRAGVAYGGLGANSPKDAVYPGTNQDTNGEPLHSDYAYIVHFDKARIPPVNAFWSLTMYNEKDFLAENPINRFTIGDRNNINYNPDGSLDIYLQKKSPGKNKVSNWLPAPQSGPFKITLRLYWPKEAVLNRSWQPPVVRKIGTAEIN